MTGPDLSLQALPTPELVQGQVGSYYRVTCREKSAAGKRLLFDAGNYNITGGDTKVDPCFTSLQKTVLAALPAGLTRIVYVQGHASTQSFARPQRLDPLDTHLKSLSYLPKTKDGRQFASKTEKQTITTSYINKQLPVMRAASVADRVSVMTKGRVIPLLVEGEFKETADEASRSFDFIVYVNW